MMMLFQIILKYDIMMTERRHLNVHGLNKTRTVHVVLYY